MAFAKSTFSQSDRSYPGCAGLRPACLHVSPLPVSGRSTSHGSDSSLSAPFYLKAALCRGHADRRSAHPGISAAQNSCHCWLLLSQLFSRAIALILGARASGPHVFTFLRCQSAAGAPRPALPAVSALRFISKRLCAGVMRTGGPRTQESPRLRTPVITGFC